MKSYFETDCPGCSRRLRVREAYSGLSIVCNHCGQSFVATPTEGAASGLPTDLTAESAGNEDDAAEQSARQRVAELEAEVRRLSTDLEVRTREAEEETRRSHRASEDREQALAALTLLEDQLRRLTSDLENRTREAEEETRRSHRAREEREQALAALGLLEDEHRSSLRRRESDARLLGDFGECLADRDRLRSEIRHLSARLESVESVSIHRAERISVVEAERDRLESVCRELTCEIETSRGERDLLRSSLREAVTNRDALSAEFEGAVRRWDSDRQGLLEKCDRIHADRDRAVAEHRETSEILQWERADRVREADSLRCDAHSLRCEIDALRMAGETLRDTIAGLMQERQQVEESLKRSVEDASEAQRQHEIEADERSRALSEAARLLRECKDRLADTEEQVRSLSVEIVRGALDRERETEEHRRALETLRNEQESRRRALEERIAADRAGYDEEISRQQREIESLRVHRECLQGEVLALHEELETTRNDYQSMQAAAVELAAERDRLLHRLEETSRASESSPNAAGCVQTETGLAEDDPSVSSADRSLEAEDSTVTPPSASMETVLASLNGQAQQTERVSPEAPPFGETFPLPEDTPKPIPIMAAPLGTVEPSYRDGLPVHVPDDHAPATWPLPEAADLDAARHQIALLSDLLHTAQKANASLSDRLSSLSNARPTTHGTTSHQPTERSRNAKERDEAAFHLHVARRAAWLSERRRTGRS